MGKVNVKSRGVGRNGHLGSRCGGAQQRVGSSQRGATPINRRGRGWKAVNGGFQRSPARWPRPHG